MLTNLCACVPLSMALALAVTGATAGELEPPEAPVPTMVPLDQLAALVASAEAAHPFKRSTTFL